MKQRDVEKKKSNQVITRDSKTGRVRVQTVFRGDTRTQQQFKDQCDINKIVARFNKTGQNVAHLRSNREAGVYQDLTSMEDYQAALDIQIRARDAFAALPSNLRQQFENDPSQLLQFIDDPKNYDEGVKLGLFEPKKEVIPPITTNTNTSNTNTNTSNTKPKKTTTIIEE